MDRLVQTSQEFWDTRRKAITRGDLSLRDICGTDALNYLFEGATRVFYEDTLGVNT
jgi:hypothetical protein